MQTPTLGEPRFASTRSHTISDDVRIPERIEIGAEPGLQFELAGPRAKLFFDPKQTRAGIVTCGGLCPGLNNVIRSLFLELHYGYGVAEVLGFRGGYSGLDPDVWRGTGEDHAAVCRWHSSKGRHDSRLLARAGGHRPGGGQSHRARRKHPLHRRRRRHAARRERSLPGSAPPRPRALGRRRAEDDRQRCRLRLAHVRLFQRGRGSGARARLRAHRGAQRAGRHRSRETDGPPRGLHHRRRDRRQPGRELRAHPRSAVQARRLSRRVEAANADEIARRHRRRGRRRAGSARRRRRASATLPAT